MKIREIKQIANGMQPRPYADHIYEWVIDIDGKTTKEEVLQFCQTYLESAPLVRSEYLTMYSRSLPFDEHMQIVCGGWYTLTNDYNKWVYHVQREYID